MRIPVVRQLNKKKRVAGIDPAYNLYWDTLVVTDAGDGNRVTFSCGDDLGVPGHQCRATLVHGDASKLSLYRSDEEVIGVFNLPFSITVQRVFCNADGTGCAAP